MFHQRSLKLWLAMLGLWGFLVLPGCRPSTPQASPPDLSNIQQSGLSLDNVVLARSGQNQKLQPVTDATFVRGSQVYVILVNVAGLAQGTDGKHKIDLELQLQDPNGQMLYSRRGLLGATGHKNLPGNRATAPYAAITTRTAWSPGNYTVIFTLRDLVGRGYITATRQVRLK
jgi:hypothetical protein